MNNIINVTFLLQDTRSYNKNVRSFLRKTIYEFNYSNVSNHIQSKAHMYKEVALKSAKEKTQ